MLIMIMMVFNIVVGPHVDGDDDDDNDGFQHGGWTTC
jgi:hypothetical protein